MMSTKSKQDKPRSSIKISQNFIKNPGLIVKLLGKSSIASADTVYEIGTGTGLITNELAKHCRKVITVEADSSLVAKLREKFMGTENVSLIEGDFLEQSLPNESYKVFSNIPFNLTSDIVRKLVEADNPPEDSYLFVQKEAAMKLAGKPFGSQETQFSLLMKPWFELSVIHKFNKTDFQPAPAVEVVLLRIRKLPDPLVRTEERAVYRNFIVYAFNTKKPRLKKGLEDIFTHNQFKRLAKALNFELNTTPAELQFEQWRDMFEYFLVGVTAEKQQLVMDAEAQLKQQQQKLEKVHRTRTAKDWRRLCQKSDPLGKRIWTAL